MAEIYDFDCPKLSDVIWFYNDARMNFVYPAIGKSNQGQGRMMLHLQREMTPHRERKATETSRETLLGALSLVLATLGIAGLLFAWASWAHNGLASPLTYASNGVATVLLIALWINEKTSSRPWLNKTLRAQTRLAAACWLEALGSVGAGVALILLALTYYCF
jgi:hypothetical protein